MASNFYNSHGFPQCIVAVDDTHVGVKRLSLNASDFINKKRKYALNIQVAGDYIIVFRRRDEMARKRT